VSQRRGSTGQRLDASTSPSPRWTGDRQASGKRRSHSKAAGASFERRAIGHRAGRASASSPPAASLPGHPRSSTGSSRVNRSPNCSPRAHAATGNQPPVFGRNFMVSGTSPTSRSTTATVSANRRHRASIIQAIRLCVDHLRISQNLPAEGVRYGP
jgi:hypothetical protein